VATDIETTHHRQSGHGFVMHRWRVELAGDELPEMVKIIVHCKNRVVRPLLFDQVAW
jgi:hypothetical protein